MQIKVSDIVKKYNGSKKFLNVPERYLNVFEFRNGIVDGKMHTLKETGEKFKISGTRASQMEARVIYELTK